MSSLYDWSITAINNQNSDSGINWLEGQNPNTVNGSARAMMGRVAEFLADIGGSLLAGGSANALTVTANSAFTTYANGRILSFIAASDNTTAATLNVNGIGAKSLRKMTVSASGDTALSGTEIQAGGIYVVQYSTAANASAGGWLLVNPTIDLSALAPIANPSFTGAASITSSAAGDFLTLESQDAGAGNGPNVVMYRNSASPAVSDVLGVIYWKGKDSAGNVQVYGDMYGQIIDPVSGTEDFSINWETVIAGTVGLKMTLGAGLYMVGATGGDKGSGTVNAVGYYLNGTAIFPTSTDNAVARFDGTAGVLQNSTMTIADNGNVTINGTLTVTG